MLSSMPQALPIRVPSRSSPGPSTGTKPGNSGSSASYTASGSVAVTRMKRAPAGAAARSGSTWSRTAFDDCSIRATF